MTALYNRYRPRTFAEVRGQEHVTGALAQALLSGRLHHAYLFSGPRGCGKTSSARILAASLNCVDGPTPEPCGVCEQCVAIREGTSLDVVEIDAASHNGVEDARDLRERAFFAPVSARRKVYVVDEAHMITKDAFNALLKVVEEPPPFLTFVFATTEPDKVLPTIRSRTFQYAFRLVPPRVLEAHLVDICAREGAEVEPAVLPLVVRAAAGSVRDALSVLDQLLAGAGGASLSREQAAALLGLTDGVLLDEAVDAVVARDGRAVFALVDRVVNAGHDPRRFAADLLERFRDLVVLEAVPDAVEQGLLDSCPADQVERMRGQAARLGPAGLARAADLLHAGLVEMRGTTSPRLLLELVLARVLLPAAAVDESAMLARLDRLERVLAVGGAPQGAPAGGAARPDAASAGRVPPAAGPAPEDARPDPAAGRPAALPDRPASAPSARPAPGDPVPAAPASGASDPAPVASVPPQPPSTAPPVPSGAPAGGRGDVAALRSVWPDVLRAASRRKRYTGAMLGQEADLTDLRDGTLVLTFQKPTLLRQFRDGVHAEVLVEALQEVLGASYRVEAVAASSGGQPPAAGAREAAPGFAPGDEPADDDPTPGADSAGEGTPRGDVEAVALATLNRELGARPLEP